MSHTPSEEELKANAKLVEDLEKIVRYVGSGKNHHDEFAHSEALSHEVPEVHSSRDKEHHRRVTRVNTGMHNMPAFKWFYLFSAMQAAVNESKGFHNLTVRSWLEQNAIPAQLALVHSEVSEATEAFRKGDKANFEEELADIIIRTMGIAHALHMDVMDAMEKKLNKNIKRPYRHGGKKI